MIGTCDLLRTALHSSIPFMPGMDKSLMIKSGIQSTDRSRALSPFDAVFTSYPCDCSMVFKTRVICVSSSTTSIRLRSAISARVLRHNVHIHCWRIGKKAVHRRQVKVFAPTMHGGSSKNNLGDFVFANKIRDCGRDDGTFELGCFGPQ